MGRRRVVVTGLGAVTPVGNDVPAFWDGLLAGRSGGAPIQRFDASRHKVRFAAEVKGYDPGQYMDRKEVKRSDPYTQFAMGASVQAMTDAGLAAGGFAAERFGTLIGSGIGGILTFEEQHSTLIASGPDRISPFFIPSFIGDIAAGVVSMRFGLKGPNYAVQSACATSAHAIGEAFRTIVYGDADLMLCGGSEAAISPMSIAGFGNMKALSERNDDPAAASRPFDVDRDGFVMGDGAAAVVLEELGHAERRGARIYGEIVGYAATGDAYHMTGQPDEHEGLQRAMRRCLADAGLAPGDVDYVNAHGTSTPLNDPNEAVAIQRVFGDAAARLSVSSTKSATGHMLGAAGAVEFVACALAIRDQVVPPTINLHRVDPACGALDFTPLQPRRREIRAAISNSSGFGGHNVTLALRRFEG
jgi:3-oxoacyl-[acyl-carrier-protein] synthase II